MSKLTLSLVKKLSGGEDVRRIQRLDASNKSIAEVNDLSPCLELLRLDLSHNDITSVDGIVHCAALTWLDLSHNRLDSLVGLRGLVNLAVLRASHNSITACGDLSHLSNLKALILCHNQLSCLQGLPSLTQLNTLVLSHNQFESVSVEKLSQLSKLSVSHNLLRAVPNIQSNLDLRELRLNDNKLESLPESLQCNTKLKILDLGNNRLKDANVLEPLRTLWQLGNLNLKGNRLCDKAGYPEEIVELLPSLSILDGRKMAALQPQGEGHRKEDEEREQRTRPELTVTTATVDSDSGRRQKKRVRTERATDKEISAVPLESEFGVVRIKRKKKQKAEQAMEEGVSACQKTHKSSLVKSIDGSDSASVSSKRGRGEEDGTLAGTHRRSQHTELESRVAVSDSSSAAVLKSVSFATQDDGVSLLPFGEEGVREGSGEGSRERKLVDGRRKGLKDSLKGLAKGRSGVVAVKEVRRKRRGKRRESGGWDPASATAGSEAAQVGSGQSSTWT